jgi:hypothetical protein
MTGNTTSGSIDLWAVPSSFGRPITTSATPDSRYTRAKYQASGLRRVKSSTAMAEPPALDLAHDARAMRVRIASYTGRHLRAGVPPGSTPPAVAPRDSGACRARARATAWVRSAAPSWPRMWLTPFWAVRSATTRYGLTGEVESPGERAQSRRSGCSAEGGRKRSTGRITGCSAAGSSAPVAGPRCEHRALPTICMLRPVRWPGLPWPAGRCWRGGLALVG